MDALTRLLAATRPYKPFSVTFGEETLDLYARKPGAIETSRVQKAWTEAYQESKRERAEQPADFTSLYSLLKKQTVYKLAEFITSADRRDYLNEASSLNDDKPIDDPQVIKDADVIEAEKYAELVELPHQDLLDKAWERREHYEAVEAAGSAQNYMMAVVTIYQKDGETYSPLFPTIKEAESLNLNDLASILTAAFDVIAESVTEAPLVSAPQKSSSEPTPSPDEKAAASPSKTSSGRSKLTVSS